MYTFIKRHTLRKTQTCWMKQNKRLYMSFIEFSAICQFFFPSVITNSFCFIKREWPSHSLVYYSPCYYLRIIRPQQHLFSWSVFGQLPSAGPMWFWHPLPCSLLFFSKIITQDAIFFCQSEAVAQSLVSWK